MKACDDETVIDDANAFGQEWQVLDTEPTVFRSLRLPPYPLECTLPTPSGQATSQFRRRLSESIGAQLAAEKACAHWGQGKDDCIFNVLTTGVLISKWPWRVNTNVSKRVIARRVERLFSPVD
jgi:hypothetical protein